MSFSLSIKATLCTDISGPQFAHVEQLEDLASTINDSLDLILSSDNDPCSNSCTKLGDAVTEYATSVSEINRDHGFATSDESWTRLAGFLNPKLRLRRELRTHLGSMSKEIREQGDNVNVSRALEPDIKTLTVLAEAMLNVLDLIDTDDVEADSGRAVASHDASRLAAFELIESTRKRRLANTATATVEIGGAKQGQDSPLRSFSARVERRQMEVTKSRTHSTDQLNHMPARKSGIRPPMISSTFRQKS